MAQLIAKTLGVGPNDKIDLTDPGRRAKIAQSIALVENGPGKGSIAGGAPVPAAGTAATGGARTPAPNFGQALAQGNIGGMLGALNTPGASGQSPLQSMSSALGGDQQQQSSGGGGRAPAPAPASQPSIYSPQAMHNMQVAAQAPTMLAQTIAASAKPLSWGAGTPGGGAGQQIPGTTLNSVGAPGYG